MQYHKNTQWHIKMCNHKKMPIFLKYIQCISLYLQSLPILKAISINQTNANPLNIVFPYCKIDCCFILVTEALLILFFLQDCLRAQNPI